MVVNVKLMSMFAKYLKDYPDGRINLDGPATVRTVAEFLGLPIKRVRIITVNGKQEMLDKSLSDGDLIYIFPPAIGGG
ncbi:MAG: MoaD/ThiS family protein [Planctomycetes bacterium]|nr:MoaD/ThiS family protein [Planctomycetota bacterium]